jgi:hypothetical protein
VAKAKDFEFALNAGLKTCATGIQKSFLPSSVASTPVEGGPVSTSFGCFQF